MRRLVGRKVHVRLASGGVLRGIVKEESGDALVIEGADGEVIVYKHAVAYVVPVEHFLEERVEKHGEA